MKHFLYLPFLILLAACSNRPKHPQAGLINNGSAAPDTDSTITVYADSIYTHRDSFEKRTSLVYQQDEESFYIEKYSLNGSTNLYVEHTSNPSIAEQTAKYFLKNDTLVFIDKITKTNKTPGVLFRQEKIYFRKNIPFKVSKRFSASFSALQGAQFKESSLESGVDYAGKMAMFKDAALGQGDFKMVFDRLIESGSGELLVLKSKTPAVYSASLLINQRDRLIDSIAAYPSNYTGNELDLDWRVRGLQAYYVPVEAGSTSARGLNR